MSSYTAVTVPTQFVEANGISFRFFETLPERKPRSWATPTLGISEHHKSCGKSPCDGFLLNRPSSIRGTMAGLSVLPNARFSRRLSAALVWMLSMTSLTIELPDEQRAALAAKARARGLSAEQYARKVLEYDLASEWLRKSWETAKEAGLDQLSMDQIDAEIAAARKARREPRLQPGS